MTYYLAQLNIARFRLPQADPVNADFINNLERVNGIAEQQAGFIWRFTGAGDDAMDVQAFEDANIAVNMSVWENIEALSNFVYRNDAHKSIMRRRKEWFDKLDFHMVLWWTPQDRLPTLEEAKIRLQLLQTIGPSHSAFTFAKPFGAPHDN